jgi:hypothetical protein
MEQEKLFVIKDAEENRMSWKVVKLSESDEANISEHRGFEEIDSNGANLPRSVSKQ